MNNLTSHKEKNHDDVNFYYNCIEAFGNIEDAMKNMEKQANNSNAICTELSCSTLGCTNSVGCAPTLKC